MYAEEMGKVKVGTLECNPLESHEIIDIKNLSDQMEKLEEGLNATIMQHDADISQLEDKFNATNTKIEKLNEAFLNMKKIVRCPTEDTNYRLISGRCYYLDLGDLVTYENAQRFCAEKFVGGKLFEPENLSINNLVWNSFKDIMPSSYAPYIGINENNSENNFHYDSSGVKISFIPPWETGSGNRDENTCVYIWTDGKWGDYRCSYGRRALCEQ